MRQKRGISNLVATVILVASAISIAILIFVWISHSIKEETEKSADISTAEQVCRNIEISMDKITKTVKPNTVLVKVENKKDREITALRIRIETENEVEMKKKGVSTLVVTSLLVTFVIAIGLIVTIWMRTTVKSFVDEGQKDVVAKIECLNINLKLEKKDVSTIYIKNNGDADLSGYISLLYDQGGNSKVFEHKEVIINSYAVIEYPPEIPLEGESLSGKSKIKIVPWITADEGISAECVKQAITLNLE